jgi:TonB-linked SusC/RagA family outer membrane protein
MKKKPDDCSFHFGKKPKINWLAMKLLTFLLFAGSMTLSASIYSQKTKIDLHLQNSSLADIFSSIEKSSEFIFFYNDEIVNDKIIKSVSVEGEKIEKILDQLFGGTNIAYKIDDRQVFLYKKDDIKSLEPLVSSSLIQQVQKKEISGSVKDSKGLSLPGVTVLVKGTTIGTITDADGQFRISVPADTKSLVFSFVGMKSQEITITGKTSVNVIMEEETKGVEEVVVVGYGVQKKIAVTGAISTVGSEDILKSPASNVATSLAGRVSGFAAVQNSGQPGNDDPAMYVRGVGSLSAGSSAPLIMVDGVERSFNRLDPNEIESISILKDASSTAVYGVRGANGVILVTTKRGKSGRPQISISSNFGVQQPTQLPQFADSYTYALRFNEKQTNDGVSPDKLNFSQEAIEAFRTNSDPIVYPNTDWVNYMLKPFTTNSSQNINIRGGDEKVRYFVSLGYRDEEGIWNRLYPKRGDHSAMDDGFWYKQYNLRANLDIDLTKTTLLSITSSSLVGNRNQAFRKNATNINDLFQRMYWGQPYASPGIIDGRSLETGSQIPGNKVTGIDFNGGSGFTFIRNNNLNFDVQLTQKLDFITKGMRLGIKAAYNYAQSQTKSFGYTAGRFFVYPLYRFEPNAPAETRMTPALQEYNLPDNLSYSEANSKAMNWYAEAALNYERSFGNHNITGLLMYNESKIYYPATYAEFPRAYAGLVGRAAYNYKLKYFLESDIGYNGSENFAKGRRFGFFPSVSAGWMVSEESFMKKIPFINYLKLRGSYGFVGNDQIGGLRFLFLPDTYNAGAGGYNFGDLVPQNQITAREGALGNPLVTWEKSKNQDYGIDLKFFKGNLGVTFDYFYNYRYDILITRNTVPAFIPVALPAVNLGRVSNKGYEVEVEWHQNKENFGYYIGFNLSYVKNKILFNDELPQPFPYMARTGQQVSQNFGYITDGFWSVEDVAHLADFPKYSYTPKPGDLKYKDLNSDKVINENDQRAIGNPANPLYTGGLRLGMNYKGFDFSILFSGAAKTSRLLQALYSNAFWGNANFSLTKWISDGRWTPETAATATFPRLTSNTYNSQNSDFWLRDASYARLKNAEIGYSISNINRLGISKLRVFASGSNLLTFSKFKEISDPEAISQVQYPLMIIYNLGLTLTFK